MTEEMMLSSQLVDILSLVISGVSLERTGLGPTGLNEEGVHLRGAQMRDGYKEQRIAWIWS